jgi:Peptidase A4 family
MSPKRLFPALALSMTAAAIVTAPASAASAADATASSNWSGYAAAGARFSSVSGTWVQPAASCDSGTDAAFWVGLGGADGQSPALEQAGTEVDCSNGTPTYSAWYEMVPAAPVQFDGFKVSPGDKISTKVGVDGNQVSISMTNQTTGDTASKQLRMDNPDVSSAEWIAEAPSSCQGGAMGACQPVPLADFDKVDFSGATATADGHTGTISDSQWTAQAMQLSPNAGDSLPGDSFDGSGQEGASATSQAGATPSDLSADGSAFSVTRQTGDAGQSSSPGVVIVPDTGGDDGGGYGYDGGGYGYDGGGGYGDGGYGYDGGGYGYDGGGGYGYDGGGYGLGFGG